MPWPVFLPPLFMHLVIYVQTLSMTNYTQGLLPTQKGGGFSPLQQPPPKLILSSGSTSLTGRADTRVPSPIIHSLRDYETLRGLSGGFFPCLAKSHFIRFAVLAANRQQLVCVWFSPAHIHLFTAASRPCFPRQGKGHSTVPTTCKPNTYKFTLPHAHIWLPSRKGN